MPKQLIIYNCLQCEHFDTVETECTTYCLLTKKCIPNLVHNLTEDGEVNFDKEYFPEWCPLPNIEEQK